MRELQAGGEVLMLAGVEIVKDMSLEVLNRGLDASVIEDNSRWRKKEGGMEGVEGYAW